MKLQKRILYTYMLQQILKINIYLIIFYITEKGQKVDLFIRLISDNFLQLTDANWSQTDKKEQTTLGLSTLQLGLNWLFASSEVP